MIAEQGAKTGGVEHGAAAENPVFGEAGQFEGNRSHHVHRVGSNDDNGVGRVFGQLRNDVFKNSDVGCQQVVAGFAGFLVGAGGDDDDVGVAEIAVSPGLNFVGIGKRGGVRDVFGFGLGPFGVLVNQNHFAGNAPHQQRKRCGTADAAGTDNSYFKHGFLLSIIV